MSARRLMLVVAMGCAFLAGCRSSRHHRPPPCPSCPPAGTSIPPVGIPEGPPPPAPVPRGASPDNGAELLLPQQMPPGKSRSEYPRSPNVPRGAILGDPDYVERPRVVEADPPKDESGPPATKRPESPDVPVGLDWLKAQGYKTVVYIRNPKDDDTTDRRQVERRGMKFVSLSVTADTLSKDWIDNFNETVGRSADRPVFVYSRDASVAAAVWYLHLRTAEFLTHDEARLRAARLGLKDERSEIYQAALKVLPPM
jgi:protein tyrosine phosphatase (PTP) superfamily phosphohydrolase (DUF442 family)